MKSRSTASTCTCCGRDGAGEFAAVDHASAYERIELVVYSMFAVAFMGFMGFAVILGRFLGDRIVNPIVELAQAVEMRSARLPLQERSDELLVDNFTFWKAFLFATGGAHIANLPVWLGAFAILVLFFSITTALPLWPPSSSPTITSSTRCRGC